MRATGNCPNSLYCFMLMVRGQARSDTQDVEGMNFVWQGIAKVAPRLMHPGANARMVMNFGDPKVDADVCAAMHYRIVEYPQTQQNAMKFVPLDSKPGLDVPTDTPVEVVRPDDVMRLAAR